MAGHCDEVRMILLGDRVWRRRQLTELDEPPGALQMRQEQFHGVAASAGIDLRGR
jgi:hypothetical protein